MSNKTVVISKKAELALEEAVLKTKSCFETGGLLLGYKLFDIYYIKAITSPKEIKCPSKTEFILDGHYHTHLAKELAKKHIPKIRILGIWHSHICDTAVFSNQDRITNRTMYKLLGNIVSLIATNNNKKILFTAYEITNKNSEKICKIERKN